MATCRDIITRSMRQLGILSIGREPKATEADYALGALQSLYDEWIASGLFGRLTDVYKDADYTAKEYERVTMAAGTLTIPETLETDTGDYRAPYQYAVIIGIEADVVTPRIYVGAGWVETPSLTLDDEAPLSTLSVDGLAACLSERVASPFGVQPDAFTVRAARLFRNSLSFKLGATQPPRTAVYF